MQYLILVPDGAADWPLESYDMKTPLEAANTPFMDRVVELGVTGQFCPIPEALSPGSDIGNLSMFGYNPRAAFRGRAPIEAANQGIHLADDEVAFRCNLVTLEDGVMRDFTAGHITSEEGAEIIASLNAALGAEFNAKFYPGVSYRHLVIVRDSEAASLEALVDMQCTPPHDITDQAYAPHLPQGNGADVIAELIGRSRETMEGHPVNTRRLADNLPPATSIWLWGQGKAPAMESYASKFGLTGAVVSAVDLVQGIGVCAGLDVLKVPGATGWIDTDYEAKVKAGLEALETRDMAFIHLEAPDETAHQGRADLKIQAIEDFDRRIVGPCLAYYEAHPDTRILIAPDHFTLIQTKTHEGGPVPFALCGAGVKQDAHAAYCESEAARTDILIKEGFQLVDQMLRQPEIDLAAIGKA